MGAEAEPAPLVGQMGAAGSIASHAGTMLEGAKAKPRALAGVGPALAVALVRTPEEVPPEALSTLDFATAVLATTVLATTAPTVSATARVERATVTLAPSPTNAETLAPTPTEVQALAGEELEGAASEEATFEDNCRTKPRVPRGTGGDGGSSFRFLAPVDFPGLALGDPWTAPSEPLASASLEFAPVPSCLAGGEGTVVGAAWDVGAEEDDLAG
jgi:hypothetical protein